MCWRGGIRFKTKVCLQLGPCITLCSTLSSSSNSSCPKPAPSCHPTGPLESICQHTVEPQLWWLLALGWHTSSLPKGSHRLHHRRHRTSGGYAQGRYNPKPHFASWQAPPPATTLNPNVCELAKNPTCRASISAFASAIMRTHKRFHGVHQHMLWVLG